MGRSIPSPGARDKAAPVATERLGFAELAAFEGDEISEWVGQRRREWIEGEGLRDVEACGFGGGDVGERS